MRKVIYDKRHAVTVAATGTSFTFQLDSTLRCRGRLAEVVLEIPNYTNTVTTTFSLVRSANQGGGTPFTGDAHAKNATYTELLASTAGIMTSESDTYTLTLSGVAGAGGGTVYVTPIIVED